MNRWDIYWADMPYEDVPVQRKTRPVIIAADKVVYALVLRVTSHAAREDDDYDYAIQEWQYANLSCPSVVRIQKIAQLRPDDIGDYIGHLHITDIVEIQSRMKKLKEERDRLGSRRSRF